jgi:transcription initiation factor TFIIF subunit alpha
MKFNSREPVDVMTWQEPVKLNRKDPRRQEAGPSVQEAVGPMLGLDGKPVIGADGRIVMVDADGRPIHNGEALAYGKDGKDKGAANGKKKFQKKTKQVFIVPEAVRQLRREEKYPWVIEDGTGTEVWTGQMEEVSKAETHGFFMPTSENKFQFVSAHRWYKFQRKQNHTTLSAEEVEKLMEQQKKNRDPEFWLMRRRNGQAPSAATSAIFKADAEGRVLTGGSGSLVQSAGQSLGPGGRRLKAVDKDTNELFGENEDGEPRRRKKEDDGEGDMDEMLFDEEFADDDEGEAVDNEDEEAKELEERLKKEYKSANKQREGYMDESDDEDEEELTKDGKAMKKLIRNLEKNTAYDSDDERNPYASSEEEEEEEPPAPTNEQPAIQQQPSQAPSRSGSQTPSKVPARSKVASAAGSRATSPAAPSLGGHSVVAKRATSPSPHKGKANGASRGNSPLSGGQNGGPSSRATSPSAGSRAASPGASGSAAPTQKPNKKRKATDEPSANAQTPGASLSKKRKSMAPIDGPPVEAKTVIEWLRNTPGATTKDCIRQFTKCLKDKPKRDQFTAMMRQLAVVKDGVLMLRNP